MHCWQIHPDALLHERAIARVCLLSERDIHRKQQLALLLRVSGWNVWSDFLLIRLHGLPSQLDIHRPGRHVHRQRGILHHNKRQHFHHQHGRLPRMHCRQVHPDAMLHEPALARVRFVPNRHLQRKHQLALVCRVSGWNLRIELVPIRMHRLPAQHLCPLGRLVRMLHVLVRRNRLLSARMRRFERRHVRGV